jgi:hypothetical protein
MKVSYRVVDGDSGEHKLGHSTSSRHCEMATDTPQHKLQANIRVTRECGLRLHFWTKPATEEQNYETTATPQVQP